MTLRLLAAVTVAAAALVPAPTAVATCHICFAPVDCDAACDPLYDVLSAVESAAPASRASTLDHTACDLVADTTRLNMDCHH